MTTRVLDARRGWLAGMLRTIAVAALLCQSVAVATAPVLLRTSGYEAPVRGGPGDLLLLAGAGFQPTDRVVYRADDPRDQQGGHPSAVPAVATAREGSASVVKIG